MYRLLKEQLTTVFGEDFDFRTLDAKVITFMKQVGNTYSEYEKEKKLLEQEIETHSKALINGHEAIEVHNHSLKEQVNEQENLLQQYKNAIDATLIVSKTTPKGIITYVNEKFTQVSGYSAEELIGQPHSIIKCFENDPKIYKELWDTIGQKNIWRGEIKNKRKDGSYYYVDATIFPILSSQNEIIEYIALRKDITSRVTMEEEIEKQLKYSEMLFNKQQNIVFTANKTEGVINANQKFFDTLGFKDLDEFKEKYVCICELFIEREGFLPRSNLKFSWVETILSTPNQQHKALLLNADGQESIFNVVINAVTYDNESFVIANFTDITELEEAREQALASERTKADFMANMSHEIRTPMNSIIGFTQLLHKTPLSKKQIQFLNFIEHSTKVLLDIVNNILDFSKIESGNLELDYTKINPFVDIKNILSLFAPKAKEKDISYLINIDATINECIVVDKLRITQILTNLINNAMKFTPQNGTIEVQLKHLESTQDKENICFSVIDSGIGIPQDRIDKVFQPFTQADSSTTRSFGGTGLGLSISSSLCSMMGGKLKAQSTVGKGSRFYFELTFDKCHSLNTLATHVNNPPIYIVEDKNKTIYDNVVHHLKHFHLNFKPIHFSQLIGLHVAHHTIILFDYRKVDLIFDNTANILLIDEHPEAFKLAEINEKIYHIGSFEECPSIIYNAILELNLVPQHAVISPNFIDEKFDFKILVAEDYDMNRILIDEILSSFGIKADFAVNGLEALEKGLTLSYDLIFMDINMPELNGIDATKQLHEKGVKTPIIALTANALEGDREYFLSLGMDEYISKPIDILELEKILKHYRKILSLSKVKSTPTKRISKNEERIVYALTTAQEKMRFSVPAMKRFFEKFLESGKESINDISSAVENGDLKTVYELAHALKSVAFSLNLDEIGSLCETLEYGAKEKKLIDYRELSKKLDNLFKELESLKEVILLRFDNLI